MKRFKDFQQDLTWEVRFYVLLSVLTIAGAHFMHAWDSMWVSLALTVLACILFVEVILVLLVHDPRVLRILKWLAVMIAIAFILVGTI